ncbi:MAG: hypothetical protein ACRC0G_12610 [Fusobacteriaceae bacterium]
MSRHLRRVSRFSNTNSNGETHEQVKDRLEKEKLEAEKVEKDKVEHASNIAEGERKEALAKENALALGGNENEETSGVGLADVTTSVKALMDDEKKKKGGSLSAALRK